MAIRSSGAGKVAAVAATMGLLAGAAGAVAQQQRNPQAGRPRPPVAKPGDEKKAGGLQLPPADPKQEPGQADDPLMPPPGDPAGNAAPPAAPVWPFHYSFRMKAYDGQPVAARYYPSNVGANAPVVLLVHENGAGRSGKDFEDPVAELKKEGLAAHLQKEGYAALVIDLRGHGANPRRALTDPQWKALVFDLQAAYHFLLDRHNRRELNVGKLAVVGLGEGANLVANWAAEPGAAVSVEGRPGDLAAMALVSPLPEDRATRLAPAVASLAPRVPILAMAGEGDAASSDWVKEAKEVVERQRLGKTALVEGKQHGYNLLRFTPGATAPLLSFLEATLKGRPEEWEPRFNLDPVQFTDVQVVAPAAPAPAPAEAAAKAQAPAPAN